MAGTTQLQAPRHLPTCTARRGEDTAAHLIDHVLPRVPYQQWVFTFPSPVRLALSRRPHRVGAALQVIACIKEPDVARKILEHLGLRAEALPTFRAQAPPVTLEFGPAA